MKKTIICLLLSIGMLLSLCACGEGDAADDGVIALSDGGDESAEDVGEIYELVLTHVSGLVSALTLLLTAILTNLYKKDQREKAQVTEKIKVMMRTEVEELSQLVSTSDLSEHSRRTVEEKLTIIRSRLE